LPVKSRHHVVAVLELLSFHPQGHEKHISDMFNAVGNQVGIFLERKILEEMLAVRANQQHLLAEAGIALSSSFDLEKRLNNITHLVVPEIADWCAIDTIDQGNVLRRIAAAHVDESKEQLLYTIQPTRTINFDQDTRPQIQTLFTGQSLLYPEVSLSLIEASISNPEQLEAIRQLNPISSIIVPLIAHNKTQGILTFVYSDSSRRYSSGDLALAEDIARRTALAVENALLYNESQKLNAELEQRVDKRTAQLRTAIDELRKQIMERQNAEERIHNLNAELEQRIEQRTSQLEIANRELNKELVDRKKTSEALKILLKRTRELYRISQTIGVVKTPSEVLGLLLSSSYLKSVSRASIAILERPWLENGPPPENCFILTEWNRGVKQPRFFGRRFTLEEYGLRLPVPYGQPIVIQDIQSVMELPERVRKRFADLATHSLIILPLVAGGEWFGLLSLHFKTRRMTNMDDLRHVRGLVDEAAIVIKNMRLLEAESQARHDAERANELKLKFLGMISHELRTPLTSIKGFTTTLLAEDVQWPPEKQRDFLMTISQESDKLHELIEQLLDLSRIEAGVLRIAPVEVSLAKVIESARPQLSALTIEHELKIEIPPDLPLLVADEQRIAQVVTNLVSNAVKFSPAHSQIILMARTDGKNIQVDVADQGAGIPAADRQRVFAAFRQLENGSSSQAKGAGLGLAICKGLVEAHHGRIWVQDHEQPGTVISFTLPALVKVNPASIR
jgi:signal transduction histidine kinase